MVKDHKQQQQGGHKGFESHRVNARQVARTAIVRTSHDNIVV